MKKIKLNERQQQIIAIVKEHQPITGEQIGSILHVSRATLRSDLAILTMFRMLDARPKVGYFYLGQGDLSLRMSTVADLSVEDVMTRPIIARPEDKVYDLIVQLFLEDSSSIYVTDGQQELCGIVSRKDFLKVTISGSDVTKMPVGMIMTRMPNILTISPDTLVSEAVALLAKREVDSLPVVVKDATKNGLRVVGKFSKTVVARLFSEAISSEE